MRLDLVETSIGLISLGVEGRDEYLLLQHREGGDLTPQQASEWLLERSYRDTDQPGGYYCHRVSAVQSQDNPEVCICTVHHRYDV